MNIPAAYKTIKEEYIPELRSQARLLRHIKSGARVFLLENDDDNKVFSIGFRTPVDDSTGKPHILEHSVLCGSDRYPVKDPFMELVKSSLQTFINAITFSDKTIYPVASCNETDLKNLMAVYMDAVFHPNIYKEEKIFRQEGWHYELDSREGELTVNGVVYNEMKGAFSDPEEVLERYSLNELYPDTNYSFESGGDPADIPTLSYQTFLDFHSRYYHPCNSYIYLYGNMDFEDRLEWLDSEYLSRYDIQPVDSAVRYQQPFTAPREKTVYYPLTAGEDPAGQAWLSTEWSTGSILDPKEYVAFQILEYALLAAEGAPLKQSLLDAEIGEDIFGGYRNEVLQPYFNLVVKNTDPEQKEKFLQVVDDTLRRIVREGIGERSLAAAINISEFRLREADYGSYPKGLLYGIQAFDSWLYDENEPWMHLRYEDTFRFLKENISTGYFEGLISKYLLDNPHRVTITLVPEPGLTEKKEQELKDQLAAYKASLSDEELDAMIKSAAELKQYQAEPSSREDLAKIPTLDLADISRDIRKLSSVPKTIGTVPALHQEIFTGGITYMRLMYDVSRFGEKDLPLLGLLRMLLGMMDTDRYTFADLSHEINLVTGGLSAAVTCRELAGQKGMFTPYFEIITKMMHGGADKVMDLLDEIIVRTHFEDEKRLLEIIRQLRSRMGLQLMGSGHSAALSRANSHISVTGWYFEQEEGLDYLRFLEDISDNFEERKAGLIADLRRLCAEVFDPSRVLVSITDDAEGWEQIQEPVKASFGVTVPAERGYFAGHELTRVNEAYRTPGQVNYAAVVGDFSDAGLEYTGALRVFTAHLRNDYLWNNVRVLGGAYGCMCGANRSGRTYFVSYRDPHIRETYDIFNGIVDHAASFEAEKRDMDNLIISVIGGLDTPLSPSAWGVASLNSRLTGITDEMRQRDRDEVLGCTAEDIRALAPYMAAVLKDPVRCVVGTATQIDECADLFDTTDNLLH